MRIELILIKVRANAGFDKKNNGYGSAAHFSLQTFQLFVLIYVMFKMFCISKSKKPPSFVARD